MPGMISNPGNGAVVGATLEQAFKNIGLFISDLSERGLHVVAAGPDQKYTENDGRFRFWFRRCHEGSVGEKSVEVDMPGIERVRYVRDSGMNAWDYPRLFVDGNSWLWCFALNMVEHALVVSP